MFNKEYMQQLLNIYPVSRRIFSMISAKEVIIVCVCIGHTLSDKEKQTYYRYSYIEKGVEISIDTSFIRGFWDEDEPDKITVYNYHSLKKEVNLKWSFIMRGCTLEISHTGTFRTLYIGISIPEQRWNDGSIQIYILNRPSRSLVVNGMYKSISTTNTLWYCKKHRIGSVNCSKYGESTVDTILDSLNNYVESDVVEMSCSLYTCRPSMVMRNIISIPIGLHE